MALTFADYQAGVDVAATWLNKFKNAVLGYINALDGSVLTAGTVGNSALAKNKSEEIWNFLAGKGEAGLAGTSRANADAITALNIDGATATYTITGWSVHFGNSATALAKVAGCQLLVKVAGATQITIDLNSASLAVGTPLSNAGLNISVTAGQVISIDYVAAGAPAYPCPNLALKVTVKHCST